MAVLRSSSHLSGSSRFNVHLEEKREEEEEEEEEEKEKKRKREREKEKTQIAKRSQN